MEFDSKAHRYTEHAQVQDELATWAAKQLPPLDLKQKALELGAGTGLFTKHLVNKHRDFEASDISAQMLKIGRQAIPHINWKQRNAWSLKDGQWDIIYSASLLQWAPNPDKIIQHWKSHLNAQGRIIVCLFVKPTLPELESVSHNNKLPIRWLSPQDWATCFEKQGFTLNALNSKKRRFNYADSRHFLRSLHQTGAITPQKTSYSTMKQLLKHYQSRFQTHNKHVYATWTFCFIDALLPQ